MKGLWIRTLAATAALWTVMGILTAPLAQADTLKVGAILAVTGPASFLGGPEARTMEMLVEKINASGGVGGHQLQLVIKDSGADAEKAVSFAKQLIEEEKVFAILGPSTSGETLKIKGICEEAKMLLISCAAAELIVNPVARYVFKTPQNDSDAIKHIFTTMQKMGISRIAFLSSNTGFGKAGAAQLKKIAPDFGIQILLEEVYDSKATDLTPVVTKVAANPEVQAVVNWSIEPAQAILAKNIAQANLKLPLFQSHGFGNIEYVKAAGAAAEGIIFPAGLLLVADQLPEGHPQKALLLQYKKDYETKYPGELASTFGGHGYDALMLLAEGIKAGGADREKVRSAIEGIKGFAGTAGVFNFSPSDHVGLGMDAFSMLTVKDGAFTFYGK
ncbi:MAG: ABC transporter substrate-binding protein [Thermodesulfobacteriota bacterium]